MAESLGNQTRRLRSLHRSQGSITYNDKSQGSQYIDLPMQMQQNVSQPTIMSGQGSIVSEEGLLMGVLQERGGPNDEAHASRHAKRLRSQRRHLNQEKASKTIL